MNVNDTSEPKNFDIFSPHLIGGFPIPKPGNTVVMSWITRWEKSLYTTSSKFEMNSKFLAEVDQSWKYFSFFFQQSQVQY